MSKFSDRNYLKEQQYKTSKNLDARIALHTRFGTNPYGWFNWVWDHLDLKPGMRVLEAGCGPGKLWQENSSRLPRDVQVALSDLSAGMVGQAQLALGDDERFSFLCVDAQDLPLPDHSFDLIVANHMLYHVPDIRRALGEFARILRPGGRLCAATNGAGHMRRLHELVAEVNPEISIPLDVIRPFRLENGPEITRQVFPKVELHRYPDDLIVTEMEPLRDYILSMADFYSPGEGLDVEMLESHLSRRLEESEGKLVISKSQGIILAGI